MGQRDMEGTITVTIARPDKFRRVEEMQMGGMVGGPTIERVSVFNGTEAWDDMQNRGGMGGGMQIDDARGPRRPGAGPGGGAPAPTARAVERDPACAACACRCSGWMVALLADAGTPWVDAGIAESPDGKADMLETKEETGRTLRLFIDQATHLPLMVQYQDPKPMIMMQGGPGRGGPVARAGGPGGPPPSGGVGRQGRRRLPAVAAASSRRRRRWPARQGQAAPMTPEEVQKRIEEMRSNPPQIGTFAMHLTDYKKVDGVMLPHKIRHSLDGQPNEEWTIEKYKVNPHGEGRHVGEEVI